MRTSTKPVTTEQLLQLADDIAAALLTVPFGAERTQARSLVNTFVDRALASPPDYEMFSPAGNLAVQRIVVGQANKAMNMTPAPSLEAVWEQVVGELDYIQARSHPEATDTAVREAAWAKLQDLLGSDWPNG